ncbi:hydantoinase/oxoprolinase family protein, partial [Mycobacterium sp.]|uniref:hydantoinase/oxoprolinase family protein n=1 Tax=Mycobacterium sp. TaxID=1785 RepID=UPI0025D29404
MLNHGADAGGFQLTGHAHVDAEVERADDLVARWLGERIDLPIVTSNEVVGLIREYPRLVTTAANAATIPVLGPCLDSLQRRLAERGVPAGVLLMLSNGGAVAAAVAARLPVRAVESGPAAGAHFAVTHAPDRMLRN